MLVGHKSEIRCAMWNLQQKGDNYTVYVRLGAVFAHEPIAFGFCVWWSQRCMVSWFIPRTTCCAHWFPRCCVFVSSQWTNRVTSGHRWHNVPSDFDTSTFSRIVGFDAEVCWWIEDSCRSSSGSLDWGVFVGWTLRSNSFVKLETYFMRTSRNSPCVFLATVFLLFSRLNF